MIYLLKRDTCKRTHKASDHSHTQDKWEDNPWAY